MDAMFPKFYGNQRTVRILSAAITRGQLSHAYLLAGPWGSGKKTLSRAVAKRIFCPDSCGQCQHCQLLVKDLHPDFRVFGAEGLVRLEVAREFKAFIQIPPSSAPLKIAVLENCHRLTNEAANSLLNILEDPPAHALCFLTAEKAEAVLPTIISRAQLLQLSPLPAVMTVQQLVSRGVEKSRAEVLAAYSDGILGRALEMNRREDFFTAREEWTATLIEILAGRQDPLKISEKWLQDIDSILEFFVAWFRDIQLMHVVPGYSPVNRDLGNQLKAVSMLCPVDRAIDILESCARSRERLLANCNARLVLDSLMLRMWKG